MTSSGYITELPGEILGKIFTSLDYPHLKSVRPTCRRFEPYAAARLFETVTVVLSLQGLCRLRNIALSPIIACQVRELDFQGGRLDYFGSRAEWEFEIQQRYFAKGLGSYIEYGKQELTAGWKAYRKLLNEQKVPCGPSIFSFEIRLTSTRQSSVSERTRMSSLALCAPLRISNQSSLKRVPPWKTSNGGLKVFRTPMDPLCLNHEDSTIGIKLLRRLELSGERQS
jgi:hypothetical protein